MQSEYVSSAVLEGSRERRSGVLFSTSNGRASHKKHGMRHDMTHARPTQLSEPFAMCPYAGSTTPFCGATDGL